MQNLDIRYHRYIIAIASLAYFTDAPLCFCFIVVLKTVEFELRRYSCVLIRSKATVIVTRRKAKFKHWYLNHV